MSLPFRIALRYLFARKSYNVINMISWTGAVGMAIGTAALVIIMSVFNGFNLLVQDSIADFSPELVIKPAAGKFFVPDSSVFAGVIEDSRVLRLSSVLEDQAFITYDGNQSLARVRGVDKVGESESALGRHIVQGEWALHHGELPLAVVGASLAGQVGLSPRFVTPFSIYAPRRDSPVSLLNPSASLSSVRLRVGGIISVNAETDASAVIVPIETMRWLLDAPDEVSSIEIWCRADDTRPLRKWLQELLGPDFRVLDRYHQNESVFRMMKIEKFAIFLILIFVVVIVAFNIYSSLKMLVLQKQEDIFTLRSMGADDGLIRKIFLLEGWMVSLLGMAAGLLIGILLVLLQNKVGLVPMPGNFVVQYYPVSLKITDILAITASVAAVGLVVSLIPSRRLKS